jgi:hypothetical protein
VRVAANDGCTRKREALLGADDVDDTLSLVAQAKIGQTELLDIVLERHDLSA